MKTGFDCIHVTQVTLGVSILKAYNKRRHIKVSWVLLVKSQGAEKSYLVGVKLVLPYNFFKSEGNIVSIQIIAEPQVKPKLKPNDLG